MPLRVWQNLGLAAEHGLHFRFPGELKTPSSSSGYSSPSGRCGGLRVCILSRSVSTLWVCVWVGIYCNGWIGLPLSVGACLLFGLVCIYCNGEMGFPCVEAEAVLLLGGRIGWCAPIVPLLALCDICFGYKGGRGFVVFLGVDCAGYGKGMCRDGRYAVCLVMFSFSMRLSIASACCLAVWWLWTLAGVFFL